jgi:hypothetical protein
MKLKKIKKLKKIATRWMSMWAIKESVSPVFFSIEVNCNFESKLGKNLDYWVNFNLLFLLN